MRFSFGMNQPRYMTVSKCGFIACWGKSWGQCFTDVPQRPSLLRLVLKGELDIKSDSENGTKLRRFIEVNWAERCRNWTDCWQSSMQNHYNELKKSRNVVIHLHDIRWPVLFNSGSKFKDEKGVIMFHYLHIVVWKAKQGIKVPIMKICMSVLSLSIAYDTLMAIAHHILLIFRFSLSWAVRVDARIHSKNE